MAVSAFATFCFVKNLNLDKFSLFVAGNHHLRNSFTIIDHKLFLRQVDKNYADFTVLSKLVFIFDMIAGRLELFPILILLTPSAWKKS